MPTRPPEPDCRSGGFSPQIQLYPESCDLQAALVASSKPSSCPKHSERTIDVPGVEGAGRTSGPARPSDWRSHAQPTGPSQLPGRCNNVTVVTSKVTGRNNAVTRSP